MKIWPLIAASFAATTLTAHGAETHTPASYPTHEVVRYVMECMADHGGQSWGSLYNCSCKIDTIAAELSHDEFVAEDTAERGKHLAGERGGVLRETELAEDLRSRYDRLDDQAEKRCFSDVQPHVKGDADSR